MSVETALPRRDDVPTEDRWDVESVFADERAFDDAVARVEAALPTLAGYAGTLGSSAGALLTALTASDEMMILTWHIYLYASMQVSGDQTNGANTARLDRAMGIFARYGASVSYIEPELLALPSETLDRFTREEPKLAVYGHYFDKLGLRRAHVRSAEVEELLAQASDPLASAGQIHQVLENADLTFAAVKDETGAEVRLAQGNSDSLIESQTRSVRRDAWQTYADGYLGVKNTMAATLAGGVKSNVFYARAHRYPSALEASVQPHNIPVAVFETLIATVRAHLPLWHRYWSIRRRALGVADLHPYDLHVPLATAEQQIPYDRGVEMLADGLAPLGEEYVAIARRGLTVERWVDKYPNIGKGSGAHSTGAPGTYPFLMQNYDDTLLSLSTLAHELGHSMHSYYAWQTQPPIYSSYSMFVAETASNFNQALLRARLLESNDDPRFQVAVIEEGMSNFQRYFFIMPILAQFERAIHEQVERGEGLTADGMSATLVSLYREGFGDEVVMDEPRVGITWAQFPHLFGNFYVWQYATGISAANALAAGVVSEGASAAERYIQFLKAGDALYPIDALKLAGVDMTTPEPVERAFSVLEGLIDRLDKIAGDGPLPWLPSPDC